MARQEEYVAVAFLTGGELQGVGQALQCVLPIEDLPEEFVEILARIDCAEQHQLVNRALSKER